MEILNTFVVRFLQDNPTAQQLRIPKVNADAVTAETALKLLFGVTGALAVLIIIIISLQLVLGGSDPEKIARAKKALIYTFVGLAIVLTAEGIVLVILNIL